MFVCLCVSVCFFAFLVGWSVCIFMCALYFFVCALKFIICMSKTHVECVFCAPHVFHLKLCW